ncbi:MAG: hypothetical protein J0H49_35600 [Acidobacteria bacterium]|nr:hypothetical protein [Acidobacteriota bacterium]
MASLVQKSLGMLCLMIGLGTVAMARIAPEIDGASATSALTLLTGAVLVIRSRRR